MNAAPVSGTARPEETSSSTRTSADGVVSRQVFETDFIDSMGRSYDVSLDGQSLYVVKQPNPPDGTRVYVVTGWTS